MIVGGITGSIAGGWIADRWHLARAAGRVWTAFIAASIETAAILAALAQSDYRLFLAAYCIFCVASGGWTGVAAALGMDIVDREHRGTAVAAYFLVTTVLGPGLGAWVAGLLGDALGSVSLALALCCGAVVVGAVAFIKLGNSMRGLL
jgi:MFS family permease